MSEVVYLVNFLDKQSNENGEIIIPEGTVRIEAFSSDDFIDYYNAGERISRIILPDSLEEIGDKAFADCQYLSDINLPANLKRIGNRAFSRCESLESVVIPDSVTSIGDGAFYNCKKLTSVVIPDSVTIIGKNAFGGCENLKSVSLPDNTYFEGQPFDETYSLTSFKVRVNDRETIEDSSFSEGSFRSGKFEYWFETFSIPSNIRTIERGFILGKGFNRNHKGEIKTLEFLGQIPETNGAFEDTKIEKIRVNLPRKQVQFPEDIKKKIANNQIKSVIYAAPQLCTSESELPGYITLTSIENDELVEVNIKYIAAIRVVEINRFKKHEGARLVLTDKGDVYEILVYEPRTVIIDKIKTAMDRFKEQEGSLVALFANIDNLQTE